MFLRVLSSSYLADIFWFPPGIPTNNGAHQCPLSPCGRGPRGASNNLIPVRGCLRIEQSLRRERTPHPALRATFHHIRLRQGFGGHEGGRKKLHRREERQRCAVGR